jgi:hypothetical protein
LPHPQTGPVVPIKNEGCRHKEHNRQNNNYPLPLLHIRFIPLPINDILMRRAPHPADREINRGKALILFASAGPSISKEHY